MQTELQRDIETLCKKAVAADCPFVISISFPDNLTIAYSNNLKYDSHVDAILDKTTSHIEKERKERWQAATM